MPDIILTTLNSRYIHSAFGLRYLYANLAELQPLAQIIEFTIHEDPLILVEKLLQQSPKIIGFSVYIWNVTEITTVIHLIKQISPQTYLILGGPEVSHIPDQPDIVNEVDYVIKGAGEISFRQLCQQLLAHQKPIQRIIEGIVAPLEQIKLPYRYYTDEDIKNRLIYVEASRGCPFKCEFCLSALDKTAKAFTLSPFLIEIEQLIQRGARNFKFIDRTFNLKIATTIEILTFFLDRMTTDLYLHFEVIPDHLPNKLKAVLTRFPKNTLQFEIGVQTFDSEIQHIISRRQDNQKTIDNLTWLRTQTGAHLHVDLIFGLPQDNLNNFAKSFDQLVALNPQEIQLGILKRLRGAPINRHTEKYQLRYNPQPPYQILSTRDIDFFTMQRVHRFARYWDMIANSGRFKYSLPLILASSPFHHFMILSDVLYKEAKATWKIALKRLYGYLYLILIRDLNCSKSIVYTQLKQDFQRNGEKGNFDYVLIQPKKQNKVGQANQRQQRH